MADSLRNFNTFGIDATCRALFQYDSVFQLRLLLRDVIADDPYLHIGRGSNLLFVSEYYDGFVLHSLIRGIEVVEETTNDVLLKVGAGEDWDNFVAYCVNQGWYGLENLSWIPGQVGASAVQNIGAYGVEVCDYIEKVDVFDVKKLTEITFAKQSCCYGYRTSAFKKQWKNKYIVTYVYFRLQRHFSPVLTHKALKDYLYSQYLGIDTYTAQEMRSAIIAVRQSKLPEPAVKGSAGSFFMNPILSVDKGKTLLKTFPLMPCYNMDEGIKIPAAWLIEQCGWKGKKMGNAAVYEKQALVLVNDTGRASGVEIARLAEAIQTDVLQKFGIEILPEVLYIY